LTNTSFKSGKNNKENGIDCIVETPKGKKDLHADVVLISIGRKPFTGGL